MLVFAAPSQTVVLLGDVGELEEERERALHVALLRDAQPGDRVGERLGLALAAADRARERANPLLEGEEAASLLLDEHPPEQLAEQAHVGPQRRIAAT